MYEEAKLLASSSTYIKHIFVFANEHFSKLFKKILHQHSSKNKKEKKS